MPQATDIVLKNGAGTPVDKTFTLYAPAAGDNSFANWRLKEGLVSTVFPRIAIQTRPTGRNGRKSVIKLQVPASYTDASTGLVKTTGQFDFEVNCTVPDEFPEALKADAVAFAANLLNHSLVKAVLRDAQPAT